MFKRKKLNFFVAMIMVMTLMFGSTMCLAAEKMMFQKTEMKLFRREHRACQEFISLLTIILG